jgi:hypothetical protein
MSSSQGDLAKEGALWYLELCATAVRVQEERLLREPGDPMVDLWFTLIALRNGVRAARLAASVATNREEVDEAIQGFEHSRAATEIRNVFEHFDAYFVGEGKLQVRDRSREPKHYAPRIETTYEEGDVRVMVRVGDHELRIPEATQAIEKLLWKIRGLLDPSR